MFKFTRRQFAKMIPGPFLLSLAACGKASSSAPPGTVPSRIVLSWAGDPARTQAVTWRTEVAAASPQAQVARFTADPKFGPSASTVPASVERDDLGDGGSAAHYAARFEGLEPDTAYCYRVGDGQVWSEWNVFRTASTTPEPFRFLYLGDEQNSIKSLWSRSIRRAYAAAPDARFLVHAGDLVNEGYDDGLWGEWSYALGSISATVPSIPVPGNHDLHRPKGSPEAKLTLAAPWPWRRHFALPSNGPDLDDMSGQSYYVDYQGVRFIALDVNAFAEEGFDAAARKRVTDKEVEWVTKVLSDNPNRWTIVVQHQAIYAIAKDREYAAMRAALAPLYEKYHVDLVLQGHDHVYARTHKIAQDRIVDPSAPGVVYVISVSGPKMYKTQKVNSQYMAKMIEDKQFYQIVDVSPERLALTAYSIDGAVADGFELRKNGGCTTYIDHSSGKSEGRNIRAQTASGG
ncbi:MAG: fibronectin type III domain-containing protein [Terriglobia bacterium]